MAEPDERMSLEPWQVNALKAALRAKMKGQPTLLDPLPWRVRLRLWLGSRIDHAGCWLVDHGHCTAAEHLWRICGQW